MHLPSIFCLCGERGLRAKQTEPLMQCLVTYNFFTVSLCLALSWTNSLSAAADNATPTAQGHSLPGNWCLLLPGLTWMVLSFKCCLVLALIWLTMHHHLVHGALKPQLDPRCSRCSNQLQKMCHIVSRLLNTDVFTCTPARWSLASQCFPSVLAF